MGLLKASIQRARLVQEILQEFRSIGRYLQADVLQEQAQRLGKGEPLRPFLDRVTDGYRRLDSLIAYESNRSQRTERLKSVLDALEQYEATRIHDPAMPKPGGVVADDQYGAWWAALVECLVRPRPAPER